MCKPSKPNIPPPKTAEEKKKEQHDAEPAELVLGGGDNSAKDRTKQSEGMRRFIIPVLSDQPKSSGLQIGK